MWREILITSCGIISFKPPWFGISIAIIILILNPASLSGLVMYNPCMAEDPTKTGAAILKKPEETSADKPMTHEEIESLSDMIADAMNTDNSDEEDTGKFSRIQDEDTGEFEPVKDSQ
jgi:hypothetical protein